MINKVILIGRLGKNPEVRNLDNGTSVAKFSLATDENYKDKNGEWQTITEWTNCVAWGAIAERVEKSLERGNLVYIEGKLQNRSWQTDTGETRYATDVKIVGYRKIGGGKSNNQAGDDAANTLASTTTSGNDSFSDDLPF